MVQKILNHERASSIGAVHLEVLDALRGIAALTVAYYHCRAIGWIGLRETMNSGSTLEKLFGLLTAPFSFGGIGVPFFFVLSGYVIHRKHVDESSLNAREFIIRRFVRIYPVLLVALIVTAVLDVQFERLGGVVRQGTALEFVCNLAALQGVACVAFGSNTPLWTLAIEIQLYAFYPLALAVRKQLSPIGMLILAGCFSLATWIATRNLGIDFFAPYFFSWWLGAFIADLRQGKRFMLLSWTLAIACLSLGCAAVLLKWHFTAMQLWAIASALALGHLLSCGTSNWTRIFRPLGTMSYSLYAAHLPIALLASAILFSNKQQVSIVAPLTLLAISVSGAFVVYWVAERPAVAVLKALRGRTNATKWRN